MILADIFKIQLLGQIKAVCTKLNIGKSKKINSLSKILAIIWSLKDTYKRLYFFIKLETEET